MKKHIKKFIASLITGAVLISMAACDFQKEKGKGKGFSNKMKWDFSDNSSIVNKEEDGGLLTSLTIRSGEKDYKFQCSNCQLEDGKLVIGENGSLVLLTDVGCVGAVEIGFDISEGESNLFLAGGYNLDKLPEVESSDDLIWGEELWYQTTASPEKISFNGLPNYLRITPPDEKLTIENITVYFDGVSTELIDAKLNTDFYGFILEGSKYDSGKEIFSFDDGLFVFYLNVRPDSPYIDMSLNQPTGIVYGISDTKFVTGDIHSSTGTKKDRTSPLEVGDTIEVKAGAYTFNVDLPVCKLKDAKNLWELMPSSFTKSTGITNVLVVPFYFSNQADFATAENRKDLYSCLGRVIDDSGNVTDYTGSDVDYSFTEYFDMASYGQLNLNCYVTDFYQFEGTAEENNGFYLPDNLEEINNIQKWVNEKYSDKLNILDQDGDRMFDAVVFINAATASEDYMTLSYEGAYNHIVNYGTERVEEFEKEVVINKFASVNYRFFNGENGRTTETLCHEFSHQLGLIDYYDVQYSGINAIGTYDMQSSNEGDWNSFSKFSAGWIKPKVVTSSDISNGVEITINAFEKDGSAIVIPTALTKINSDGTISPFSEYIIIDLFTPDGLYANTCSKYDLNEAGVRIYHVDSRQLAINLKTDNGTQYQIGTNYMTNVYNESGFYYLEMIQKKGINTFTDLTDNLRTDINKDDLFYVGDSFSMNTHKAFFFNGKMDDESSLDYTVTVVKIENGTATIRISK